MYSFDDFSSFIFQSYINEEVLKITWKLLYRDDQSINET